MKLSVVTISLLLAIQTQANVDWRSYCPQVKNQGECGSDYAFAAIGAIECAISRRTDRQVLLSEQEVIDCSRPYGNHGCDGGFPSSVFNYVKSNGGVNYGAHYPYEGADRQCRHNRNNPKETITSYAQVQRGSEAALQQAIATIGPVVVCIDVSQRSFMMYNGGVYDDPYCTRQLNHCLLAVGYGTENGRPYYLLKNSWGTGWGEDGYVKIAANKNMCGIADMASYPLL